ncbi:hypothetical protein [Streptomyces sp. NPDC057552]|uniref:hypothetical protein n=1 Tax=Streptomyces sp. NPDC057552 TaxID=3350537 RepID=UPI00369CA721
MALITSGTTAWEQELLYAASRKAIASVVKDLWPGKDAALGASCPSVTSYVCEVTVPGEQELLYAKYSWLSTSLVSILRGAKGPLEEVQEAQLSYVRSADLLTRREAQHLAFLRELGRPRVCDTVGLHNGVLLTRAAKGRAIADEMAARPWDTAEILDAVLLPLTDLHGLAGAEYLRGAWPINERSIADVFLRKFNGPDAARYTRNLGKHGLLREHERLEVVSRVENAVRRLLRLTVALPSRRTTAVFGDLKPEHVYLDGPRLTFIDPAIQWAAGPQPDIAKLVGRTMLLALCHPEARAERQITAGVVTTLRNCLAALPKGDRAECLRQVLVLWLMDTVSILSTCLSAPPSLPLAHGQQPLARHALRVATVADRVSALLIGSMSGIGLLDAAFSEVGDRPWAAR